MHARAQAHADLDTHTQICIHTWAHIYKHGCTDTWTVTHVQSTLSELSPRVPGFFSLRQQTSCLYVPTSKRGGWGGGGGVSTEDRLPDVLQALPSTILSHTRVLEALAPLRA